METSGSDDHYALLGVDPRADAAEVRRAWRRLALRWHPDRAGPDAAAMFRKLSAAYVVLADPLCRAAYDRRRRGTSPLSATPRASASGTPAPAPRSTPGTMLRRLSGPLNALFACGAAGLDEEGVVELFVNPEEAAQGGMVTISMRVAARCPVCRGDASVPCRACEPDRTVDELFSAWLAVPPDVVDGTELAPTAQFPGVVRPVRFRVRRREPRLALLPQCRETLIPGPSPPRGEGS